MGEAAHGVVEDSSEEDSDYDGDDDSSSCDDDVEHDDGSGRSVATCREKHPTSGGNLSSSPEDDAGFIMFTLPPPMLRPHTVSSANLMHSPTSGQQPAGVKPARDSETRHAVQIHLQNSGWSLNREVSLPRSKSCGEGRSSAPPDDFNICPEQYNPDDVHRIRAAADSTQSRRDGEGCEHGIMRRSDPFSDEGGGFKCGALCMFVPGLSKFKRVSSTSRKKSKKSACVEGPAAAVSRVVSLEKFECGSWVSSGVFDAEEEETTCVKPCFGPPLKAAGNEAGDMNAPLHATFLFDKDLKGVLKRADSKLELPKPLARHVRFSTSAQESAPSSPTERYSSPRLRSKAREAFNAYIEAQI